MLAFLHVNRESLDPVVIAQHRDGDGRCEGELLAEDWSVADCNVSAEHAHP